MLRLQNWAFTQGFALATESTKPKRVVYHCTHHKKETRNTRKTAEADRERVQTQTQARGCQFSLYISKTQRLDGQWAIGSTCLHHNHAPNPDPFHYTQHWKKKLGHAQAVALATAHRGVISYTASAEILQKEGLELSNRKEFYNLERREEKGELTKQEELQLLLTHLDDEGLHPRVRAETVEDGGSSQREIRDLFWMSSEQIKLARRFVSGFIYETDATFNTNSLKLPLSVMVGIDNTRATFPIAYCYITSESAASFKWIAEQLTKLAF